MTLSASPACVRPHRNLGIGRVATPLALVRRAVRAAVMLVVGAMTLAVALAFVPRAFGALTLVVRSASMAGSYPRGSLVVARPTRAAQVRNGDVILVQRLSHAPVLHRVIEHHERDGQIAVRTKGDANSTADAGLYALPDRVPVASYQMPYAGYLVASVQSPLGWVLLMVLPAAMITSGFLVRLWSCAPPAHGSLGGAARRPQVSA